RGANSFGRCHGRRLRMLDDMLIHTRWSRQTEHDTSSLNDFGYEHRRLNVAGFCLLLESLLQIVQPLELEGQRMRAEIGRDRNVRKTIQDIVNIGHRAAEALGLNPE